MLLNLREGETKLALNECPPRLIVLAAGSRVLVYAALFVLRGSEVRQLSRWCSCRKDDTTVSKQSRTIDSISLVSVCPSC